MCERRILSKIPGTEKKNYLTLRPTCKNGLIDKTRRNFVNFANLKKSFYSPRNKRPRLCEDLHFSFFQEPGENFISVLSPRWGISFLKCFKFA